MKGNRLWFIFKEYFLIYTLISLVLCITFLLSDFSSNANPPSKYCIYLCFFFYILMLLFGLWDFYKFEFLRPKKIAKFINWDQFSKFKTSGFKFQKSKWLGLYKGYQVIFKIEWENYMKKPSFLIKVLFDPYIDEDFISKSKFISINKKIDSLGYFVDMNSIDFSFDKKEMKKTKYEDIKIHLNRMITVLIDFNLSPIKHKQWLKTNQRSNDLREEYFDSYLEIL